MSKTISFVLCSRNDNYMGNPVGRLEMALNYLAESVQSLGRQESVEVIVTDWGSEVPLKDVLNLNATAARITRFLEVSIAVVKQVQKDSPFAEVLALNAAARRASGDYIGRLDQDTLVGRHFMETFFEWAEGARSPCADLKKSYLFSQRRQIPFGFAKRASSLDDVKMFLRFCGKRLLVEAWGPYFFNSPVGIMILSKDLWLECGGYDERLLYWGWMEVDLAHRLIERHSVVDIGPLVRHDFYHLEHYNPRSPRQTPRKINPKRSDGLKYHPNDKDWGLILYPLSLSCYASNLKSDSWDCSHVATGKGNSRLVLPAVASVVLESLWRNAKAGLDYMSKRNIVIEYFFRALAALGRPRRYRLYIARIISMVRRSS